MRKKNLEMNPTKKRIAEAGMKDLEKSLKKMKSAKAITEESSVTERPEEKPAKRRGRKSRKTTEAVIPDTMQDPDAIAPAKQLLGKAIDEYDPSQTAKADNGKPQLTLVPMKILPAIARIREYGNKKYKSSDNWKTVNPTRYRDAAMRHMVAYVEDPASVDSESGLPHLWHLACNIAFLISMENKDGI